MTLKLKKSILSHWNLFSAVVLFLGAIWIFITSSSQEIQTPDDLSLPKAGFIAPDFELGTLTGETVRLSEFKGFPVMINFWASWCQPCRTEMPAIQKAADQYQEDGLVILAVNLTNQDNIIQVMEFTQEFGLTFPILLDTNGEAAAVYRVSALPTTYFIRHTGVIEEVIIGGPMAEALLLTRIQTLLGGR